MDREQVIALAKDSGLPTAWISDSGVLTWTDLEHFANLIETHLREQDRAKLRHCIKVMQEEADAYLAWHSDTNATLLAEIAALKEYLNDKG